MTLTNVVLPEYCRPTNVNSISSFQKRLFSQSNTRLKKANISEPRCVDYELKILQIKAFCGLSSREPVVLKICVHV